MAFLDDARDSLTEDEIATLKRLNQKSADFEATPEEEKTLFDLKNKVKTFVATRDRQKNLQVIGAKQYPIKDILQVSGYNKKEVLAALNELFPREASGESEVITKVGEFEFRDGKRYGRSPEYADFKKAGLKKAIEGFTEQGIVWIGEEVKSKGGKVTNPNKEKFAKMFNVSVADLDKQLGIKTLPAHDKKMKI
ncbi:MAG: hypothetical protein C0175_00550 [Caldisericum exile]|uniref:Uncharacterized protein n=1 Tax=Caldisericum exile TaxID=693075 RepID=A0A2J6X9M1_9BACT|nr:MAG: hypothetical protein C0175_00550 [Caldisericum exile]